MSFSDARRITVGVRRSVARVCAHAGLLLLPCAAVAAGGSPEGTKTFQLQSQVIAGGGTTSAAGGCFDLAGTIGQAVVGRASGGDFVLNAGFWVEPTSGDVVFEHGFETGECGQ